MSEQLLNNLQIFSGIIGFGLYLLMYSLLQLGKVQSQQMSFSVYNFIGSIFVLLYLMFNWNPFLIVFQSLWLFMSIYGMMRALTK